MSFNWIVSSVERPYNYKRSFTYIDNINPTGSSPTSFLTTQHASYFGLSEEKL